MKKANVFFMVLALIFMIYGLYLNNYADGGADGLSNFFLLMIVLVLTLGCLIGFFVSLFLNRDTSRIRKTVLTILALILVFAFLASIGLVGSGNAADYEVEVREAIE